MSSETQPKTGRASEGGHWYTKEGAAVYEMPLKKPAKDGRTHTPTTLRHARPHGFLWSVTTITGACDKPGLVRWKENQVFEAVHDSKRWEDYLGGQISYDEFRADAMEKAKEKAAQAAELGTAIHTSIERFFCGEAYDDAHEPHVRATCRELGKLLFDDRINPEEWEAEAVVVHHSGYGGRLDLRHRRLPIIVDFKTKDMAEGAKIGIFDEHMMQCAALARACGLAVHPSSTAAEQARCANVFISRNNPGVASLVEHTGEQIARGIEMFDALLAFKIAQTGHDPSFEVTR